MIKQAVCAVGSALSIGGIQINMTSGVMQIAITTGRDGNG